jgi:STE24 endopeptidase
MTTSLSHWQRVPADPADWFDRREIETGRAYNRPLERLQRVRMVLVAAVGIAFVVGEAGPRLLDALEVRGWALQVVVVVLAFMALDLVVGPWFDAYRELEHDRRWELSTQTVRGWLSDQVKGFLLSAVLALILLVPLWALVRSTDLWWLWGWLLFSAFTVLLGLLYPVVIAPLFNTFVPLEDERLAARIMEVAERAELDISGVLVADASRRSRAGNAYVAGLGRTRRVVLFDTILEWPHDVIVQVVAHELGHWHHAHLRRKLPILIGVQLLLFVATWALLQWDWLLELAGVASVEEPAAAPLFLLVFPAGFVLLNLATSWLSRADERQADIYALDVLQDPDDFSQVFRRLAETNKADIDPSRWKRLNVSHPPVAERLAMARRWQEERAS